MGIMGGGLFLPFEPPKSVTYVEFMKMCIIHYTNLPKFALLKENILGGLFLPSEPPKSVTYGEFINIFIAQWDCTSKLSTINSLFDQCLHY